MVRGYRPGALSKRSSSGSAVSASGPTGFARLGLRKIAAFCYHRTMTILRAQRWLAGFALAAIALLVVRYEHDKQYRMLHTGDRLAPLRVASLYGAPYTLRPSGRAMIINVFATWCGPCRMEAPEFGAAAARLRAQGVDVVGIDQQEDGTRVNLFARDFHLHYPLYVDTAGITHSVLGARIIPTTLFVDANGIIRWQHAGPITAQTLYDVTSAAHPG